MTQQLDLQTLVPPGRRYVLFVLTVFSALATWAAFPPIELTGLAWVAPALLMLVLSQVPPRTGFLYGLLFGTVFMAGILTFIIPFGKLPWLLLAAALALCYGLFGLAGSMLRMAAPIWRVPALAGAWFLAEFLRGHLGSLSLTFGNLGYSQADNLPLIQTASLFGHYGVGFIMALLSAGLSCLLVGMLPLTWLRPTGGAGYCPAQQGTAGRLIAGPSIAGPSDLRRFNRDAGRVAVACFVLVIAAYAWGRVAIDKGQTQLRQALAQKAVRVATVQAEGLAHDGGRHTRGVVEEYERLSLLQPADLIVWPETAIGLPLNRDRRQQAALADIARKQNAYMLAGAGESCDRCNFNAAYFIRPDGAIAGTYRKMDLVMFGEYVPGRKYFPFLKRWPIRNFDYTAGTARTLFTADGYTLAPLICFEGIFPQQTRQVARLGAQLMVIITSDAWAPDKSEVRIHSAVGPLRAIEARKYLVRAASIGRSAIYDPYGEILAEVPYWQNGVAAAQVTPISGLSVYHRCGDWPLLVLSVVMVLIALVRARRGSFVIAI